MVPAVFVAASLCVTAAGRAAGPYGGQCDTFDSLKPSPPAAGAKPIRVVQICVSAVKREATPPLVYLAPPGASANDQATLNVNDTFDSGTVVGAPANIFVDFSLDNGPNFVRAQNGFRAKILTSDKATTIQALVGKLTFNVLRALSAFDVKGDRVVAGVSGTIFSADVEPGTSESFGVDQGTVLVTRTVTIRLDAEKQDVDGIRVTDVISAGGTASVTYPLPFPIFKEFANAAAAQDYFSQQLEHATNVGNKPEIENSLSNLDQVSHGALAPVSQAGNAGQAAATAGASAGGSAGGTAALGILGGVGVLTGAALTAAGNSKSAVTAAPSIQPSATVSGTVTGKDQGRPSPSPLPVPTPAPSVRLATPAPLPSVRIQTPAPLPPTPPALTPQGPHAPALPHH